MRYLIYIISTFIIYGAFYITFENFFNAFMEFTTKRDWKLMGYSSIWMFLVGGIIGSSLSAILLIFNVFTFSLIFLPAYTILGGIFMTLIEFLTGLILRAFKLIIWDYSKEKFNFMGLIQLYRSIGWCGLSLIVFFISSAIKYYIIGH